MNFKDDFLRVFLFVFLGGLIGIIGVSALGGFFGTVLLVGVAAVAGYKGDELYDKLMILLDK